MATHVDPPGQFGDEAGAPEDDQDVVSPALLHIHAHQHRDGGPLADQTGMHVHVHDHAAGELDNHEHDHGHGVDYYDGNGVAWAADYEVGRDDPVPQYASSSGRQPGELRRRSRDWGEPSDLPSRLDQAAEEVAQIQRDMWRAHERLMALEEELETPDVLSARDELQRVWMRLSQREAEAHARLRAAQAAWAEVERSFAFARESGGIQGGALDEPWEAQWRQERENGLSNIDRDRS